MEADWNLVQRAGVLVLGLTREVSGLTLCLLSTQSASGSPVNNFGVALSAFLFFDISLSPGLHSVHIHFLFTCLFLFVFLILFSPLFLGTMMLSCLLFFLWVLCHVSPLLLTLSSLIHFLFSLLLVLSLGCFVSSFFYFPLFFPVL